jgi:uncharacterized protein (DUF2461 family)
MTFAGFAPKALPFYKALKFHQSREWFDANRETYESAVEGPIGDSVEDVAGRAWQKRKSRSRDRKSSLFVFTATSGSPPTRSHTGHKPASY